MIHVRRMFEWIDTTVVRTHTEIWSILAAVVGDLRIIGELGYENEFDTITVAFKKPTTGTSPPCNSSSTRRTTASVPSANEATPCRTMSFKALRNVSLDPWRIGRVVAASLVVLHFDHARTI
jgi:hypothetical protein